MLANDPDEEIVFHEGKDIYIPDHNLCFPNSVISGGTIRDNKEAQCIYVIGVVGLANYTSHYSVLVELDDGLSKNHPLILSEGVPSYNSISELEEKYYTVTVEDPNIKELSIQLTTLHGDPDMFVSTKANISKTNYEKRSENSGIYPDVVIYEKTNTTNLTKNFHVMIQGFEESTYIITYFTKTENGTSGV